MRKRLLKVKGQIELATNDPFNTDLALLKRLQRRYWRIKDNYLPIDLI